MIRRLNSDLKRRRKVPTEPDNELVEATRRGDGAAFGKLVAKYQDKLLYLAYDLLGDFEDAKDVAQEAFIRAFEKIHQFEDRAQFSTWIYRITVNAAMDHYRRRRRRSMEPLDEHIAEIDKKMRRDELEEAEQAERLMQTAVQRKHLDEALAHLSDHQRTAVVLKYFHQMTSAEIGAVLGCSENTVRIHLFRGLRNLKRLLEKVKANL